MAPNDLEFSRQLAAARMGSVKIQGLNQLVFEDINVPGSRALAQSRIDHFLHRFELEGWRRLDPLTWIPSEIPSSELQKLADNGLSVGGITDLQLPEGQVLYCFQGQHRIAAALQWLPPNAFLWTYGSSPTWPQPVFRKAKT